MNTATAAPSLGEERPPEGEAELIEGVVKASLRMLADAQATGVRPVPRGQHPKSHGCVFAEFTVLDGLAPELRHGIFATPRTYPAVIRFSNGRGQNDLDGDLHGMAIKLLGVEGSRTTEDGASTQDFVLTDQPRFFIKDVADYVPFSRMIETFAHRPGWLALLEVLFRVAILGDYRWRLVLGMRTKPTDLLGLRYWSQTPYRLGDRAVKYTTRPEPFPFPSAPPGTSKDRLREALVAHLGQREARFDFLVQPQADPVRMPVEDPTVIWDESASVPVKVATLRIPSQEFDTAAVRAFDEQLSFTPWHALAAHRPLGGVNRCRRRVYDAISQARHEANGVARREPTLADLPAEIAPRIPAAERPSP